MADAAHCILEKSVKAVCLVAGQVQASVYLPTTSSAIPTEHFSIELYYERTITAPEPASE